MNHPILKKALPHLIAIGIFIIIGIAYFTPVIDGYGIRQSDIITSKGVVKEIEDHRATYGEEPLWTNGLFGGMPTTQISQKYPMNFMTHVSRAFQLWLPSPLNYFFILMIGFYIMTVFLNIKPWLGILGSVAYALSCYFIIIIMVGHNTKVLAMGYLPAMIGAVIYTYRSQKIFLGAAFVTLFVALELTSNHLQITYYGMMTLLCFAIAEFVSFYKRKEAKDFFIRSGFVGVAFLIGALPSIGNLWGTMEYGKYTTRGGSEITITPEGKENTEDKTSGLDRSYITGWSYGVDETWNLLIPNAKGGASDALIGNEELMKGDAFTDEEKAFMQISYQRDRHIFSEYWGDQSMTAGPTYIGAILIFLCILAFIFVDDHLKWGLLAATVITTMLAWGKNFPGLTNFFIDYFPMYTKFRTVSMMLVIAQLTIPLLAILALKKISDNQGGFTQQKIKQFMIASGSLLGIILILAMMKGGGIVRTPEAEAEYFANYAKITEDYMRNVEKDATAAGGMEALDKETQMMYQYSGMMKDKSGSFEEKLLDYRRGIFAADAWRTFLFILLASLLILGFMKQKLNATILLSGISLLVIIDLWMVDKRWVNNDVAKDQSGKEVKDKNGDPVYQIWSKRDQNLKPHAANYSDNLIYNAEVKANAAIANDASKKIGELQNEKKSAGGGSTSITQEEVDFIRFGSLNMKTNYRVLNTTAKLDQDGRTSYFHKSLGGYHGAKLVRIQDVIDFQLGKEQQNFRMVLAARTLPGIDSAMKKFPVIHMMNTKYIILNPDGGDMNRDGVADGYILDIRNPEMGNGMPCVMKNPYACGNAWFVKNIKWVKNADEEITALGNFDPSETAIIDEREKEKLGNLNPSEDAGAMVKMESYKSNHITYSSQSSKENLLVFSEIFYPAGWKCFVDGEETTIIRVNYLLRAIVLKPGKHKIEMKFEPSSYHSAAPISMMGSIAVIAIVLFAFYREWKQKQAA